MCRIHEELQRAAVEIHLVVLQGIHLEQAAYPAVAYVNRQHRIVTAGNLYNLVFLFSIRVGSVQDVSARMPVAAGVFGDGRMSHLAVHFAQHRRQVARLVSLHPAVHDEALCVLHFVDQEGKGACGRGLKGVLAVGPHAPQGHGTELAQAADAHLVVAVRHIVLVEDGASSVLHGEADGDIGVDDVVLHGGTELVFSGSL